MSASVKLAAKLPADPETNGLDAIVEHLYGQDEVTAALVWLVPVKVTEDLATGERVPTVEVRRIEPIGRPDEVPQYVQELAAKLYEQRTGKNPLPFSELIAPRGEVTMLDGGDGFEGGLLP